MTHWGAYSASPDPPCLFKRPNFYGEDRGRETKVRGRWREVNMRGREGKKRKGEEKSRARPLMQIPGPAPAAPRLRNTHPRQFQRTSLAITFVSTTG